MDYKQQEHYTSCGIEPIDLMRENMPTDAFIGYLEGNITKYMMRYRHKNGVEDLEKARVYLDWLIEEWKEGEA